MALVKKLVAFLEICLANFWRALLCELVVIFCFAYFTFWQYRWSGPFHRQELEAIVTRIRALPLLADEEYELRIADFAQPESLCLCSPAQQTGHRLWAKVSKSKMITVTFETRDGGRAGSSGFAYSDQSLSLQHTSDGDVLDVPVKDRIDDHWWRVHHDGD